jgi:hypothetical protein
MITATRFVLGFVMGAICTATILAAYEGSKPDGYKTVEANERHIMWFSLASALMCGLLAAGLMAGHDAMPEP